MFDNLAKFQIHTSGATINLVKGGEGFPLLLLHGYPQTHLMWHKIAPFLTKNFTVIMPDLRGYGDSSKPAGGIDHINYSKRVMAQDQVEILSQLGYEEFYVVGHDRGGRVAHRMALDYPNRVKKLALLDIVPTYEMYATTNKEFATAYYHWFFLIQPYDLPETLIGFNPEYWVRKALQQWSRNNIAAFPPEVIAEYVRCFSNPETIYATCEDYRAAATIDLVDDAADIHQKITCPLLVLWGANGFVGRNYNVLDVWQKKAINVSGQALCCAHFPAEEVPEETYKALSEFLVNGT